MSKFLTSALCGLSLWAAAGAAWAVDLYPQIVDDEDMFLIDKDSFKRDGAVVTATVYDLFAKPKAVEDNGKPLEVAYMVYSFQFDCGPKHRIRNPSTVFFDSADRQVASDNEMRDWEDYDSPWMSFICDGAAPPAPDRFPSLRAARDGYGKWLAAH